MIRFFLLFLPLLLSACTSRYPLVADLRPTIPLTKSSYVETTASLTVSDQRDSPAVIRYKLDELVPAEVENMVTVKEVLSDRLHRLFAAQGIRYNSAAQVKLHFTLDDLVNTVTKSGFFYEALAETQLRFTITSGKQSIEKKYSREASLIYPIRPTVNQLSAMLDKQVQEIFTSIINDQEIRDAISSGQSH